jgi:CheY-like chemotaxis protein
MENRGIPMKAGMSNSMAKRKRILFVDDESSFLDTIQRITQAWSGGEWEVFVANSAGKALSFLQKERVDLVVLDIQMPVIDGLQFLNLVHRKYPNLQKVVLTGYANDNYRAACLSGGADLFLEKPRTTEAMESILATLNELAHWHAEEGFRGVLRRVGISDVIQMECLSRHTVLLEVAAKEARGQIFIQEGSIIHAQLGDLSGNDAFNRLLCFTGGEFDLKPFVAPPQISIEGSWEFLVMEALRLRDEAVATAAEMPQPVFIDTQSDTSQPGHIFESRSDGEFLPIPEAELGPILDAAKPPPPEKTLAPRIDELLICSPQGDVLFQSRCSNIAQRVNFLEFISQKARQLEQGLPMGSFDRVELEMGSSRVVVRIQNSHGLLVRSSQTDASRLEPSEPVFLKMVES